jgi:hypothetical protein
VKYIPAWFPGAKFKQFAQAAREDFEVAVDGPLDYVRDGLKVRLRDHLHGLHSSSPSPVPRGMPR